VSRELEAEDRVITLDDLPEGVVEKWQLGDNAAGDPRAP